ncbi:MAG: alpha-L-rhamnosidase C-terminal domain-containing protein [Saonia sp.]
MLCKSYYHTLVAFFLITGCISCSNNSEPKKDSVKETKRIEAIWHADWISSKDSLPKKNAWIAFRKKFNIENIAGVTKLRIAVDTKYWLYLNGKMIVFEGGLKRGPTPKDSYYDEVNLKGKLKEGENTIALLLWYFGKEGMSHKSSGKAGLIAELYQDGKLTVQTDASWKAIPHPGYIFESNDPQPNWRLTESNIIFDAQKDIPDWVLPTFKDMDWPPAKILGKGITAPWNNLVKRPIPFWKNSGLKAYENKIAFPFISNGDTIKCKLPYNAQVTPFLKVNAKAGEKIIMLTDNYKGGSEYNMRAEYITKESQQAYESLGWINGHMMYYVIPKGIQVLDLKYRETGYDTEFAGSFTCDDEFYNTLWQKALRTLYVTMRDNYMDCPDRERAQWWGDVVLESGEAFYALDRKSDALMKKGMLELMNWQRPDSTIFSPVPSGNWDKELPTQMLSSIGPYGFWNYYWQTGDLQPLAHVYDDLGKYLSIWKLKEDGTVQLREGGWTWGDWGENKDMPLLFNTQYYMALDSYAQISSLLGKTETATETVSKMKQFKTDFNSIFWNGKGYRSPSYKGETDDRSQGLAVIAGLADSDKYAAIYKVLQNEKHASPYMEKYVLEALFQMGHTNFALKRMKQRFGKMVKHPTISTLWEGWGIGSEGYGGGTTNHAWSGGGLTLLSQYVAGVRPTSPGYKTFQVKPQLGFLKEVRAVVPSIKGLIEISIKIGVDYSLGITIPENTKASVYLPATYKTVKVNGKPVVFETTQNHHIIALPSGNYQIIAN